MKLLITALTMIFFSLVANANSYEWTVYGTSKSADYYYDDIDVYKTDYWYDGMDIQETHYDITDYDIDDSMFFSSRTWMQSIKLNHFVSFKETQVFSDGFRYRSFIEEKTYDCRTYKYYLNTKRFYKNRIVYSDSEYPIGTFSSFSFQDQNKLPQLKEGKLLEDVVKNLCKSFYPNGAKKFTQLMIEGEVIRKHHMDSDCKFLWDPTSSQAEISAIEKILANRGIRRENQSSFCNEILEPPVEVR